MKKIFLILIALYGVVSFSQEKKIMNGVYTAVNKSEIIKLIIQDDKFHISALSGVLTIKNDSVFLKDNINKSEDITLKNLYKDDKVKADKIQFKLENYRDYVNYMHIGTQNGNNEPKFLSLESVLNELIVNGFKTDENNDLVFETDKAEYISIAVVESYTSKTKISKFKLPENINNATINYTENIARNVNITGIINEKGNELTLSNQSRDPLVFKLDSAIIEDPNFLPMETISKKNWTYPGKNAITTTDDANYNTTAEVATDIETKKVLFKHAVSKTFKEALSNAKKTPNKFLVVSFDLKNKNVKSNFDNFIQKDEAQVNDNIYGRDDFKNLKFNYYLATEKDKNLLVKYNIKSDAEILVFNTDGDLIYHTPEDLNANANLFGFYDDAYKEFEKANLQVCFDKVMLNKKASTAEVLAMLRKVQFLGLEAVLTAVPAMIEPTPVQYNESEKSIEESKSEPEEIKGSEITMTDDERKKLSESISPPQVIEEPVKYDYYDQYSSLKNKENLYRLKSTLETVTNMWEKIVVDFEKSNKIDLDYICVLKQQLSDEGFSKKIFGKSSFKIEDFRMLNYVFANYKALDSENKVKNISLEDSKGNAERAVKAAETSLAVAADSVKSNDPSSDYLRYNIDTNQVLNNYFSRFTSEIYTEKDNNIKRTVFDYYKKYLSLVDNKTSVLKIYIKALANGRKDAESTREFLEIFEIYFNKVVAPNKSIIENLDIDFSVNSESESWSDYKYDFSNNCNNVAWEIVKKPTNNTSELRKAIKWSETSIEIQKDKHYLYDTLGQLYYLNNQKDKAIATQQKAIDLDENSDNETVYKTVLDQMKNGTYTKPLE